jgi:hypothetical protein
MWGRSSGRLLIQGSSIDCQLSSWQGAYLLMPYGGGGLGGVSSMWGPGTACGRDLGLLSGSSSCSAAATSYACWHIGNRWMVCPASAVLTCRGRS